MYLHEDRVEEFVRVIHHGIDDLRLVGMRADAEKSDLSLLFHLGVSLAGLGIEYLLGIVKAMELNYVNMVGPKLRKACLHILYDLVPRGRLPMGFRGHVYFVTYALECPGYDLFTSAVQIPACGVHVVDAHIEAGPYHFGFRREHRTEAEGRYLEPGPAQGPVYRCRGCLRYGGEGFGYTSKSAHACCDSGCTCHPDL